jgi:putative transposase
MDLDGVKHVLGIWVENTEAARFWLNVCTELGNRGVRDVLIVCCDGLKDLPEQIETVWPRSTVQTCCVHLIRAAMRYVAYNDRKRFAAALRPVYTAVNADAAQDALLELADSPLGRKYRAAIAVWERAWDRFTPFLAFPPEIRSIIYTTNAIVTSSSATGVLDVHDGSLTGPTLRRGRGYLLHRPVRRRCGGARARSTGVGARLAA